MAVIVPSNAKSTLVQKAAEVTAVATALATATGSAQASMAQKQTQLNSELVIALMAEGKLSPLTILSTCSYTT